MEYAIARLVLKLRHAARESLADRAPVVAIVAGSHMIAWGYLGLRARLGRHDAERAEGIAICTGC